MDTGNSITLDPRVLAGLLSCAFLLGALLAQPGARLARLLREALARRAGNRPRNALLEGLRRSQAFAAHSRERRCGPSGGDIMLRADIDNCASVRRILGEAARSSAIEQVAEVLRRGVRARAADSPEACDHVRIIPGEGFVIIVRAPGEGAGVGIAQRLRAMLAHTPIDGLGADIRLEASFGFARREPGERYDAWRRRADSALWAARARSEEEIVEAELAQETILLPPPPMTNTDRPIATAA